MAHPLDGPRAKIGRAEKHLDEFDAEREKWVKSSPYAILPYSNTDKTEWTVRLHRMDTPVKAERDVWGLIIGDYVHALRSALDQLVWQLVTVANKRTLSKEDERRIAFPIVTTHPKAFWELTTVQHLRLEQALVIEDFQPYRAIGMEKTTPLADLHALWNADKHKVITPIKVTLSKTISPVIRPHPDVRVVDFEWDTDIALEGDANIGRVTIEVVGPNPDVDVDGYSVDVTFGEGGWWAGDSQPPGHARYHPRHRQQLRPVLRVAAAGASASRRFRPSPLKGQFPTLAGARARPAPR